MRAKQLRRGARVRLNDDDGPDRIGQDPTRPSAWRWKKCVAGLVLYEVPCTDKPIPRD